MELYVTLMVFVATVTVCSASSLARTIDDTFQDLTELFPGQYDNTLQVFQEMSNDVPPPLRHPRFTAGFFREEIPIFGSNIVNFYVQEYMNGNPKDIIRQSVYAFEGNSATGEIVTKFYSFVDPSKFVNAQDHPDLFKNLKWSDITYVTGCDVHWTRVHAYLFRAHMEDTCVIVYQGVKFLLTDTNNLTPAYFTVNEKWAFAANGSIYLEGTPYILTRLTPPGM